MKKRKQEKRCFDIMRKKWLVYKDKKKYISFHFNCLKNNSSVKADLHRNLHLQIRYIK